MAYSNPEILTPKHSQDDTVPCEEKKKPDWLLAKEGINLIINNNHAEAEALFLQYPNSLVMFAGYSFAVFMDALMSFEEEKLTKAILVLREVEKRCTTENGWFKSISQKVFGGSTDNTQSISDQMETQIILADSQVCLAILTFLQQDISGYFKGGWILRKAWKVYQKTYREILSLYRERIGELHLPDPVLSPVGSRASRTAQNFENDTPSPEWLIPETSTNGYSPHFSSISHSKSLNFAGEVQKTDKRRSQYCINNNTSTKSKKSGGLSLKKSHSVTEALSSKFSNNTGARKLSFGPFSSALSFTSLTSSLSNIFPLENLRDYQNIDRETIIRLMGAISFGYGLFQLGVSLLPPSLMRLVSILGFAANRQNGIACLMYARMGMDMRAPLASLALLWYHTIVRPFYAIDGTNVQAGVASSLVLIQESEKEFSNSALFLFFAGRTNRLNSNINQALSCFQRANEHANHREIKILCLHEIGWCYLIQLDYDNAKNTFLYLKCASRWSRAFYLYLAAICAGATRDIQSYSLFDDFQLCSGGTRGGQLDEFLNRRFQCCPKDAESAKKLDPLYFRLLVFEMLYLWNTLASCTTSNIQNIISDCEHVDTSKGEPRIGLSNLILGSCYTIEKRNQDAVKSFRKCLERRSAELNDAVDAHISAFSQFELGFILIQNDQTREEGRALLQEIEKYSRYDFESRLNVRIHSTLKNF
ncbi:tetratricopeptide repeat protein 39C-like isoform X1 [Sitophilus oryzae]|uniref:Tetratricopeptide repeat protein 39C-like isoform X1 n=1 Tax=Sitophilus oryzae TaxID=7048 RepID=A0A6J2XTI5_SITOR|nr:tetratricopeptide repeat protein 39C-like isoform X1 [Sitophilus oryzae]